MHTETSLHGREDGEAIPSASPCISFITVRPTVLGSRGQYYFVLHDGRLLIEKTRNPTGDACRLLVSLHKTGRLEVWDDDRSYPLLIIHDIEKAAGLTVAENERHGPRVVRFIPISEERRQRLRATVKPLPETRSDHQAVSA